MPASAVRQAVFEARGALRDIAGGRELSCGAVRRLIVTGDRRALRARAVRAHLRACSDCDDTRTAAATGGGRGFALLLAPWWLRELLARVAAVAPADMTAVAGSTLAA